MHLFFLISVTGIRQRRQRAEEEFGRTISPYRPLVVILTGKPYNEVMPSGPLAKGFFRAEENALLPIIIHWDQPLDQWRIWNVRQNAWGNVTTLSNVKSKTGSGWYGDG